MRVNSHANLTSLANLRDYESFIAVKCSVHEILHRPIDRRVASAPANLVTAA